MLWGQIHIHLPPEHPIMSFETIEIEMAALSAKRFMNGVNLAILILFHCWNLQSMIFIVYPNKCKIILLHHVVYVLLDKNGGLILIIRKSQAENTHNRADTVGSTLTFNQFSFLLVFLPDLSVLGLMFVHFALAVFPFSFSSFSL